MTPTINFQRGAEVAASARIDRIVSVAVTMRPAIRVVQRIDCISSSGTGQLAESFADNECLEYLDGS